MTSNLLPDSCGCFTYCKDVRPWLCLIAVAIAWTPSSCNRLAVRLIHTRKKKTNKKHPRKITQIGSASQYHFNISGADHEVTHSRNWSDLLSWRAWAMFFAPSTPIEFSLKLKKQKKKKRIKTNTICKSQVGNDAKKPLCVCMCVFTLLVWIHDPCVTKRALVHLI